MLIDPFPESQEAIENSNAMVSFTNEMSTSVYKCNLSHPFYQTS